MITLIQVSIDTWYLTIATNIQHNIPSIKQYQACMGKLEINGHLPVI